MARAGGEGGDSLSSLDRASGSEEGKIRAGGKKEDKLARTKPYKNNLKNYLKSWLGGSASCDTQHASHHHAKKGRTVCSCVFFSR